MAQSTSADTSDRDRKVIEEFRANGGRVSGPLAGTPMILIHHVGARSGIERVTPLAYFPLPESRYVLVASNGGSPAHPSWFHNLKANPRIRVQVGSRTFTAVAEELDSAARAELWPKLVAAAPSIGEFEEKARRQIPLIVLTPED